MNTSQRTRIIAQGIALYAAYQDEPGVSPNHDVLDAWEKWAQEYPRYVKFVEREQFALFDRINAEF